MRYQYRAINANGELVTGTITSDDTRSAIRTVRRQGLDPIDVHEHVDKSTRGFSKHPRRAELALALNQLAVLLKAGVPLDEAVSSLAETTEHPFIARELGALSNRLRRGESLSDGLREGRLELPAYLHQLVRAGEMTGQLAQTLGDGVSQMEYEIRTASEIRSALIYPTILVVSGIGAVLLMFTLVVPKFTKLLDKSDAEVPFLGRVVLGTGQFFNEHVMLVTGVVGGLAVAAVMLLSNPRARSRGWDLLVGVPLVGPWLKEADAGRWATMLATLLSSRIELTQALELAQQGVLGNRMRSNLSQVTKSVRGGTSLAAALQESGAITSTGYGLIKVGQQSGELPLMLRSLAVLYEDSSRTRMKRFLTILEPLAILAIGGVIGLIMTGIMLAITSVHSISI